jgi:malate dehydrogenase
LNQNAADDVRGVVGNPANTNCLIAMRNAPDIPSERFTAMTRLDHNRAMSHLARKAGVSVKEVKKVTVWRNHSTTQYPDAFHAEIGDDIWLRDKFIPLVQRRGAAVIDVMGKSSAASAAQAIIGHVQSWHRGTPEGDWVSMAIPSTGQYDTPRGIIYSYPVTIRDGRYQVVEGLELSDFDRAKLALTGEELLEESAAVSDMMGMDAALFLR